MADYSDMAWAEYQNRKAVYSAHGNYLSERDEAALFAQCLELQVLKAPASAVFPTLQEMIVNGSGDRYNVSGYVDSQNSYGAVVRTKYTYNIEKDATGRWKCTDKFVDTASSVMGNAIIWWAIGIIGSLITYFVISSQINSMF